jgi:hypothetical protein
MMFAVKMTFNQPNLLGLITKKQPKEYML